MSIATAMEHGDIVATNRERGLVITADATTLALWKELADGRYVRIGTRAGGAGLYDSGLRLAYSAYNWLDELIRTGRA